MTRKLRAVHIASIGFAVAASWICYHLLIEHLTGTSDSRLFAALCGDTGDGGGADCASVLRSDYGYFPPRRPGDPDGQPRVPAALLGLVYYSTLAVWLIGVGPPARSKRWLHALPIALVTAGLIYSAYFVYIMYAVLHAVCRSCLTTHILNALIFLGLLLLWPTRRRAASTEPAVSAAPATRPHTTTPTESASTATPETESARVPAPATGAAATRVTPAATHPSWRLTLMTVVAIVAVVMLENRLAASIGLTRQRDIYKAEVERIQGDIRTLYTNWQLAPRVDITIRADDPIRFVPHQKSPVCVVFSDLECPNCATQASFIEKQVQPLFGGHLKVVFKHYPLNKSCNTHIARTMHRHACRAAAMVEAARMTGGNDAFWKAHDYMFQHRRELGAITPSRIAEIVGVDPDALVRNMLSKACTRRIREDVDLAKTCNVHATPTVFLDGRRVGRLAVRNLRFWDAIAARFWKTTGQPRPDNTRVKLPAHTRHNGA